MRSLVCPYIIYVISAQSFWNIVHWNIVRCAMILTWSVQNIKTCVIWKGCHWLTRFCEIWYWDEFRTDIRLHWTAPLEPDFFSYTMSRVSYLVWQICARGVFFLSLLQSNMKSCAIFLDTSMINITFINITYINDCTVTYIHALHAPMGSPCIPRPAPSVNEIYLPKVT